MGVTHWDTLIGSASLISHVGERGEIRSHRPVDHSIYKHACVQQTTTAFTRSESIKHRHGLLRHSQHSFPLQGGSKFITPVWANQLITTMMGKEEAVAAVTTLREAVAANQSAPRTPACLKWDQEVRALTEVTP